MCPVGTSRSSVAHTTQLHIFIYLSKLSFGLYFHGDVKLQVWKVPLGQKETWVIARDRQEPSQPCFRTGNLTWCETVSLHYFCTIDIYLGKGNINHCYFFSFLFWHSYFLLLLFFIPHFYLSKFSSDCHSLCFTHSDSFPSISFSLHLSILHFFEMLWFTGSDLC